MRFPGIKSATVLIFSLGLIVSVFLALWSAYKSHNQSSLSCMAGEGVVNNHFTYLEVEVLAQHPIEPRFDGSLFANLGTAYGKNPTRVTFTISGNDLYLPSTIYADLHYDEAAQTLWMAKRTDISLSRLSGAHRDFPFDSAKFDFDLTFDPAVPIENARIRNRDPGFDLACDSYSANRESENKIHIVFELHRNPLVQLTAIVLVVAGLLFATGIVFFVKTESLPTSVASFFFSLWSIRGILSSEIKTFPTLLDLAILCLCVLLIGGLGVRLALKDIPALDKMNKT
jgi:hypothetical protein